MGKEKAGLEKLYNKQLSGTDGLEIYIVDANGQKKAVTGSESSD